MRSRCLHSVYFAAGQRRQRGVHSYIRGSVPALWHNMIKYYLAPLEGITTHIMRIAVHEVFGEGICKYFTPFFSPQTKRHASSYAMQGIRPENNEGIYLVPQMLTDDAEDFLAFEKDMRAYGYKELNINLGCPSGTVVSKGRGAGMLEYPQRLDYFLEDIFAKTSASISVKTRLGLHDEDEFYRLMEVFNKYPLEELIIHARVRDEMYAGSPHRDMYLWAKQHSRNRTVYNGDVFGPGDEMSDNGPIEDTIMLGRGMVADPSLARQLLGGERASKEELKEYLRMLRERYMARYPDERHCLEKLKEIWAYMREQFPDRDRDIKEIMKARRLEEYRIAADRLMR